MQTSTEMLWLKIAWHWEVPIEQQWVSLDLVQQLLKIILAPHKGVWSFRLPRFRSLSTTSSILLTCHR
jgi:hypothetical protein